MANTLDAFGRYSVLAIALCAFVGEVAHSQNAAPRNANARDEESGETLKPIIVTAERRAENLMKVPISIQALSGEQLTARHIEGLQDLRSQIPGFTAAPQSFGTTAAPIMLRGISTGVVTANADPAVGFYVDGVYYARTLAQDTAFVDMKSLEVLEGPQGTLFGKNTIGGALNITTNKPTNDFEGSVTAGVGNYGHLDFTGVVNIPVVRDKFALRAVYNHVEHSGYGYNATLHTHIGDLSQDYGRLTASFTPSPELTVTQMFDVTDQRSHPGPSVVNYISATIGNPAVKGLLAPYLQPYGSRTSYSRLNDLNTVKGWGYTGTIEWHPGPVTLKSITGYRSSSVSVPFDTVGVPFVLLYSNAPQYSHQLSQEFQLLGKAFDDRLQYIGGLYYLSDKSDLAGTFFQVPAGFCAGARIPNATSCYSSSILLNPDNRSKSIFGQITFAPIDHVHVTGGIRYVDDRRTLSWLSEVTNYKALNGDNTDLFFHAPAGGLITCIPPTFPGYGAVTIAQSSANCVIQAPPYKSHFVPWTFGIDVTPSDDMLLYAKVSKGYRSGAHQTSLIDFNGSAAPAYGPEANLSYEVGMKYEFFDRRARITFAGYHSNYTAIQQVLVVPGPPPVQFTQNGGNARIDGFEASGVMRVAGLTMSAAAAYIDARYRSGIYLGTPYITGNVAPPKISYTLGATYSAHISVLEYELHADYGWQQGHYEYGVAVPNLTPPFNPPVFLFTAEQLAAVYQPSYGLLNASILLRPEAHSRYSLSLWVKNLTNQYYARPGPFAGAGYNVVWPGEPRTLGAEIEVKF